MRYAFLLVAAALIVGLGMPARADARNHHCATKYLHRGARGPCVKAAAWLLQGNVPMRRNLRALKYFHVRRTSLTSHFGRGMARQTRVLKRRLGYKPDEINGVWGPNVWAYAVGSKLRPIDLRIRAGRRYKAFLHPHPHSPPTRGNVVKLLALARAAIAYNYGTLGPRTSNPGGRYYYTQSSARSNFYNGITNWPEGGDCSASILGLEHLAGVPATGGTYFGFTGTIAQGHVVWKRGWSLSLLHPGDLILYGSPTHHFDHVSMVLDRALNVYTDGSTTCPCRAPAFYRFDAYEAVRP